MQCTDLGAQMLEYLAGTLPDDRLAEIRAHLAECAACRDDVDASAELWNELGAAPAPRTESARMRARFDAALQGYIDGQTESRVLTALKPSRSSWQLQPWVQLAGAAAVLLIGIGVGRFVAGAPASQSQPASEIALLREELRDTRQMVTLSLLQQQSASERLKGVTTSSLLEQPSTEVVSALLETLRRDPNVNVRLASVDALRRFGNRDAVRKSVVEALPEQESPLVQIAMVDFILESAGPEAKSVLQRLVEDMMLNQAVRDRAARGLQRVGL
ncbi:MAG TPA: HEAT repeat domain-containing protein [Vicinamibacterales bacterium]|nr:HEAT repeat domain-containing protein [Vicinamibacterales bacterium]